MEQIQFIYFQYYMQYYTVHHKENSTYMEIWHRGWWFKLRPQLPVYFDFTIIVKCQSYPKSTKIDAFLKYGKTCKKTIIETF